MPKERERGVEYVAGGLFDGGVAFGVDMDVFGGVYVGGGFGGAFAGAQDAIAALVFSPATPQPVVAGDPVSTMPRDACHFWSALCVARLK